MSSIAWGPFNDPLDAATNLGRFTDQVLDPQFGIAWIGNGTLYTLRPPTYDAAGEANIVVFEYRSAPPPIAPPSGVGNRILAWFKHQLEIQGELDLENSQAQIAASQALASGLTTLYQRAMGTDDRKLDTLGVVLDGVGVGLALVFAAAGLEFLGLIALVGGVALLAADGSAYVTELAGYDETADDIKSFTFYPRVLFSLMALPDAGWNLGKVVLESEELGAKAIKAGVATRRAATGAARTGQAAAAAADPAVAAANASKAARYLRVGASAQKRANAARMKLAMFMGGQSLSRLLLVPSTLLLIKEYHDGAEERERAAQVLRNYVFHVSAVHKS